MSDAESALVQGGGIEAAVALLLRDHPQHMESSAQEGRIDFSSSSSASVGTTAVVSSPAVLSSSLQFCVRVSDIESGEQV
jgi:hypothetical protein